MGRTLQGILGFWEATFWAYAPKCYCSCLHPSCESSSISSLNSSLSWALDELTLLSPWGLLSFIFWTAEAQDYKPKFMCNYTPCTHVCVIDVCMEEQYHNTPLWFLALESQRQLWGQLHSCHEISWETIRRYQWMGGFLIAGRRCRGSSLLSGRVVFPTIPSLSATMFVALKICPAWRCKVLPTHGHWGGLVHAMPCPTWPH